MNHTTRRETQCRQGVHKVTSLISKRYRSLDILTHRQIAVELSCEPLNEGKNFPVYSYIVYMSFG
jgi:hypothetical protein